MTVSRRTFSSMSLATLVTGCVAAETRAVGEIVPGGASQAGERDGILVPEHFVPTPKTISAEAQAMLRSASAMLPSLKAPRTRNGEAGWKTYFREFRAAGDAGIMAMAARLDFAMRYPCEVVTHALSDSNIYELTPKNLASANRNRALYYVHGGAFTLGGGEAAIALASQLGGIARCRTFVIDYRMVPDVAFPVPLDDTIEGYRFVVERVNPAAVGVYGPSAGANIAPAMLLKARDLGLPLPAACALHSSPSDLAVLGDTAHTNVLVDVVLRERQLPAFEAYVGHHPDPRHPYLSPVYGDYAKPFPPTILLSGTRDILLSDTVRLHRAMLRGGVKAELHLWEAMSHAPFVGAPEEDEFYAQIMRFLFAHMAGE